MGVHIEAHKTHQGYPETNRNDVGQESISCMLRQFHLTRIHGCMAYNLTSLEAATCTRPCRWANKEQGKCFIKER